MESIVRAFIDSKLTPLAILAALCLGVFAIVATPREEEPQIIVPMIDVFVEMPGANIKEMEQRVTIPMEKKLAEIQGVEYVYSTTSPGLTTAIVRFYVGENEEDAIVSSTTSFIQLRSRSSGASRPECRAPSMTSDSQSDALERALSLYLRRIAAELTTHQDIRMFPRPSCSAARDGPFAFFSMARAWRHFMSTRRASPAR
jgi:multidrug efflux pump subunit AcrB